MIQKYQATFARPIVDQLIAIFQRDQQAALDIVNATRPVGRPLTPFAAFLKEATPIQNWPALVLVAQQVDFDPASDIGLRTETMSFYCAMALMGTDPEWLAEDAMDMLRVADLVLTSVPLEDFYTPLPISHTTVPSGTTAGLDPDVSKVLDLRITRHNLGALVTRRGGALARGPQIEFAIDLEEQ
ncbi:MAG TPA: hypothetical protein VFC10_17360 [Terriglobia bacterium]|jgi:hypothetical protein|nr:hypothetical protein [Terriglobia bacterium]